MNRIVFIMLIAMMELNCINHQVIGKDEQIKKMEWSVEAVMPSVMDGEQPGVAGPVTGVIQDYLLVAGGANFPDGLPWYGNKKKYQDEIYLFKRKNNKIERGIIAQQRLPQPVAYCANVMTPKGLVYLGGENDKGLSDKVVLIERKPSADEFIFSNLPSLPLLLTNLSAVFCENIIYVAGGISNDGPSGKFFCLNLETPGAKWESLPDIPVKISFAAMAVQSDGKHGGIYLIGGRKKNSNGISDIFNTLYRFDMKEKRWEQKQSLPFGLSAGTAIAYGTHQVLLLGGDRGDTFSKEEKLNVAIKAETDSEKLNQLGKQRIQLLEGHPGFAGDVLVYNTMNDEWDKLPSLPPGNPVTTTAVLWEKDIVLPTGEIKAGVRTPQILVGKLN